ncbi:MAG: hypothetical protein QM496_15505 [Verrucomicrobiota bacterium]
MAFKKIVSAKKAWMVLPAASCLGWLAVVAISASAAEEEPIVTKGELQVKPSYQIEEVKLPDGAGHGIGGLAFNQAGELVVVSRRTGVVIGKPAQDARAFEWRTFSAVQMHNALGVLVEKSGALLIPQMPELTRLRDTDGDGKADVSEAVSTAWGVSGNYHETNSGPIADGKGNWFVALGSASHSGPTFDLVRGRFSVAGRRGRNNMSVPWKGWVVKINAKGELKPWASGFRQANGITMSPAGDLFVTDNQGDWKPVTPIYHVQEGKFYGHPTSLVWDTNFVKEHPDPLAWAVDHIAEVDEMRTLPAVLLPQGFMCNSASEPIFDTSDGAFGPFAGQMFVGDIAGQRILRIMLEKVGGEYQGAATTLIEGDVLGGGNNRLCLSPDGKSLYVGQTYRGWGRPAEGLKRVTYSGEVPFAVEKMSLSKTGFELSFTKPVNKEQAEKISEYQFSHYYYEFSQRYGSPQMGVTPVVPRAVKVSEDGKTVNIDLGSVLARKIYQLDLGGLKAADGTSLSHGMLCYTVQRLRE